MNDGIAVIGETLNVSPEQSTKTSSHPFYPQKSGGVLLTLVDYQTDQWQDEYGYMWSTNNYGPYLDDDIPIPIKPRDVYSKWFGFNDRTHSGFESYTELQNAKAMLTMIDVYPFYDKFKPN